jgi:hypothetical protein
VADITKYIDLITSEHADKPKFVATVKLFAQEFADDIELTNNIPFLFDVDNAIGVQLDSVGEWIGITRYLNTQLTNIFFSWDSPGLGWDQGQWRGPFDPTTGTTRLDDDHYRILLKAKIVANQWDGTIGNAYEAWDTIFASEGITILIQDGTPARISEFQWDPPTIYQGWDYGAWAPTGGWNGYQVTGGMSMDIILIAPSLPQPPPLTYFAWDESLKGWDEAWWDITPQPWVGPNIDSVTRALFTGGYLTLQPAGVRVNYVVQSIAGLPIFAFDVPATATGKLAGWDTGAWGLITQG